MTATLAPEFTSEESRAACVDAWGDVINARPDDFNSETDAEPELSECAGLPENEWLDYDGLHLANQRNIDEIDRQAEEAAEEDRTDY
ncbi:hypothetical protein [Streptomyces xantholiticus]|uniref:Uncharacterized protein n=1 Tax=Streptomyces xantholiticus TaxID=68285 RepID=A0ABV1UMI1_9ACTN